MEKPEPMELKPNSFSSSSFLPESLKPSNIESKISSILPPTSPPPSNSNKIDSFMGSTKEFLESNSLVAKVAFLLLLLFLFILALKLGTTLLAYLLGPSATPHLIDGTIEGNEVMTIPQDPKIVGSKTILRSSNASKGVEFTWSVWLFINDDMVNDTIYKHIFSKGNNNTNYCNSPENCLPGTYYPNNSPGLYYYPPKNELVLIMNTYNNINNTITIPDVPLNKWFNVIIECENTKIDVYVNGFITASHILPGVPKQNYGDVYIGGDGLSAQISNLWYWNYAITISQIQEIMNRGPNLRLLNKSTNTKGGNNYISLRWYFYGLTNPIAGLGN